MTNNESTQLIEDIDNYNPKESMIFSKPILGQVPGSKPKIEFKRIYINSRNEDGTEGELVIKTGRLYSFGVSTKTFGEETQSKKSEYTFPLCLWSGVKPTNEEEKWINLFNEIVDCCMDHLVEKRQEIGRFELEKNDLIRGGLKNPLYWKKEKVTNEKGKICGERKVEGRGPILYSKLMFSKKEDKFLTRFFNLKNNEEIDPEDLINKRCYAYSAIKIESIFIGARISLIVRLYEACVQPKRENKRLLDFSKLVISNAKYAAEEMEKYEDEEESDDEYDHYNYRRESRTFDLVEN